MGLFLGTHNKKGRIDDPAFFNCLGCQLLADKDHLVAGVRANMVEESDQFWHRIGRHVVTSICCTICHQGTVDFVANGIYFNPIVFQARANRLSIIVHRRCGGAE
jgi:hypothetical protein